MVLGLLAVAVPKVQAQGNLVSSNTHAINNTLDTVTNTGTKTMTSARIAGKLQSVTVTTVNVNKTGTQGGIVRLFGSPDGVTYYRIRSPQLHNSQVDSLLITTSPVAQKYAFEIDGNPFNYYQTQVTGIGTVTFTTGGQYIAH